MVKSESRALGSPDWILLAAMVALIVLGLMMVYSSTFHTAYQLFDDAAYFFKRQLTWLSVGALAMLIVVWLPHRLWMKLSIPVMAVTVLALLILVILGEGRNLIGSSVSPVELAKLAVVIYIGHWLSTKGELLRKVPYGLLPFTIMVGLITGLVMAQPDLSEALVIVLVSVIMFFLAGADVLQFAIGIGGGIVAFAFVIRQLPVAMERLGRFFSEWQDPFSGSNNQLMQGLIGIGDGGILGLGPGNGRTKFWWLPLAHTDSIFAVVGEELGLVGCLALIALFVLVTVRGFRIASQAPDLFGMLIASGITCWIAFQALINVAVVTGTIPFTGIALPFISVGGSSLVTCMLGIGILLSISRATNTERASS
jgi:cell division protein FtsW